MGAVTGQDVADFLGQGDIPSVVDLAGEIVPVVTVLAKSYVRDNGFTGAVPNDEIAAAIITASARLVANPEQLSTDVGSVSTRGGWQGWNLAELAVLHRYRKRAM